MSNPIDLLLQAVQETVAVFKASGMTETLLTAALAGDAQQQNTLQTAQARDLKPDLSQSPPHLYQEDAVDSETNPTDDTYMYKIGLGETALDATVLQYASCIETLYGMDGPQEDPHETTKARMDALDKTALKIAAYSLRPFLTDMAQKWPGLTLVSAREQLMDGLLLRVFQTPAGVKDLQLMELVSSYVAQSQPVTDKNLSCAMKKAVTEGLFPTREDKPRTPASLDLKLS